MNHMNVADVVDTRTLLTNRLRISFAFSIDFSFPSTFVGLLAAFGFKFPVAAVPLLVDLKYKLDKTPPLSTVLR